MAHRFLVLPACASAALLAACGSSSTPPAESPEPESTEMPMTSDAAGATRPADEGLAEEVAATEGSSCGGMTGRSCEEGLFCQFPPSAQCGAADQMGTCAKPPTTCTGEGEPVCGCDDVTYDNECEAFRASTSVATMGPCAP